MIIYLENIYDIQLLFIKGTSYMRYIISHVLINISTSIYLSAHMIFFITIDFSIEKHHYLGESYTWHVHMWPLCNRCYNGRQDMSDNAMSQLKGAAEVGIEERENERYWRASW